MGNAQQPNGSLTCWQNSQDHRRACIPIQGARRLSGVAQYWDASGSCSARWAAAWQCWCSLALLQVSRPISIARHSRRS